MLKVIKGSDIWSLGVGWEISAEKIKLRNKLESRSFAHGADNIGDGKVDGRTLEIKFDVREDSQTARDDMINEAFAKFSQADYELIAGRTDRVYKIAGLAQFIIEDREGFKQRWSEITVVMNLADPFRYARTPTVTKLTFGEAVEEFETLLNNASGVDVPLIWTFTPAVTMDDIKVLHVESGQLFTYKDTVLTAPAVGVVNAMNGTVRRDEYNAINAFSGIFLHAAPGNNTYKISCAAGQVDIAYTGRWIS